MVAENLGHVLRELQESHQALPEGARQRLSLLRLTAEAFMEPAFPLEEFEKQKRERLAGIDESRTEPESIAERALERWNNPYPKNDVRYAPTFDEEAAEISAASLDQVKDVRARVAALAVAGLPVPKFEEIRPETVLSVEDYGPHVVVKPSDAFASWGQGIELRRTHDVRYRAPDDYQNLLGDAIERAFAAGIHDLPGLVGRLNEAGVPSPNGAAWTPGLFQKEMKRLGA